MPKHGFWLRVREARLVRVLAVYLAASWLLLQVTSLLRQELDLPRWVTPSAIVLLLVGLIVVCVSVWVQARAPGRSWDPGDDLLGAKEVELDAFAGRSTSTRWWGSRSLRWVLGGVVALALFLGLARLYVARDRAKGLGPAEAVAESAAPGIAVLPFRVSGGLDVWKEGMVDLISTNLDEVAGLRAIDSRTVMARWREQVEGEDFPDLQRALQVARRAGARYALIGSAVSLGREVRLAADIYQVQDGTSLWQGQVEGSPDSVLTLVDRLSVQVLTALLEEKGGDLRRVNLASVTTASLPALRAYLQGEVLLRNADFQRATETFGRAVEADSTFALAFYKRWVAEGWIEGLESASGPADLERAARLSTRLPARDALLVRAALALLRGSLEGADSLKVAVARYPDDAEAWYLLGDSYFHLGTMALVDRSESDAAFMRATALDPSFAPAYIHLIDNAFSEDDSARAAQLIDAFARLVPPSASSSKLVERNRLLLSIAFGDSAARERGLARLGTLPPESLAKLAEFLDHPRLFAIQERVLEFLRSRDDPSAQVGSSVGLFVYNLTRGRIERALGMLEDPQAPPEFSQVARMILYAAALIGLPLPAEAIAEQQLALEPPDSSWTAETFYDRGLDNFYVGGYAADQERWPDHSEARRRLDVAARRFMENADSTEARLAAGASRALEGYALWKKGRKEEALPVLRAAQRQTTSFVRDDVNMVIRSWLARLLSDLGRPRDAEPYWRSLRKTGWADFELGKIYESLERYEDARKSYELFARAWRDADPEFQPLVEEARRAAARLTSVRSES